MATVAVDDKCVGIQGCLWIYPKPEFEIVEKKILALPSLNNAAATKLKRFLIGWASECEMDSQGRVLIPESLRKFANLEKKAVLVGQINRFEVWSEDAWLNAEQKFLESGDTDGLNDLGNLTF
jgi:MraZ protein